MPSCCCRMLLSRRLPYFMMRMWVLKDFTSSCYFPLYRKYMHNYRIINIIIFTTNFTSVCPALWRDPLFRYGGTTSGALWAIFLGFQDSGKSCRCCRGQREERGRTILDELRATCPLSGRHRTLLEWCHCKRGPIALLWSSTIALTRPSISFVTGQH